MGRREASESPRAARDSPTPHDKSVACTERDGNSGSAPNASSRWTGATQSDDELAVRCAGGQRRGDAEAVVLSGEPKDELVMRTTPRLARKRRRTLGHHHAGALARWRPLCPRTVVYSELVCIRFGWSGLEPCRRPHRTRFMSLPTQAVRCASPLCIACGLRPTDRQHRLSIPSTRRSPFSLNLFPNKREEKNTSRPEQDTSPICGISIRQEKETRRACVRGLAPHQRPNRIPYSRALGDIFLFFVYFVFSRPILIYDSVANEGIKC